MENNRNSKIAMALIAGAAAGVAAWYFMSTEDGKQSWVKLINVVKDSTDKLITAGTEQGSALASVGREASEYIAHKANGITDELKSHS